MHAAKFLSRGVSPKFTRRPKGQSTVEYGTDYRDHRLGGADRGTVGLVGDQKPVQHGGGDSSATESQRGLGVGRHKGGGNGSLTERRLSWTPFTG